MLKALSVPSWGCQWCLSKCTGFMTGHSGCITACMVPNNPHFARAMHACTDQKDILPLEAFLALFIVLYCPAELSVYFAASPHEAMTSVNMTITWLYQ